MALQKIKIQAIYILATHDTYVTDCFVSSHILNEGETFDKVVKDEVAALIEENGFDGHINDIEWIGDTEAVIRFERNEFTVTFNLTTHYVTVNIK